MRNSVDELYQFYLLQSPLHVLLVDGCFPAHVFEGEGGVDVFPDELDDPLGPPGEVSFFSHVGEGLFGSANFLFDEAEFVAESDEELAVAFPLLEGENEDAGEVVFSLFFLNKIGTTFEK